jgi:WS/DGAT/MGAT family acyltransferase
MALAALLDDLTEGIDRWVRWQKKIIDAITPGQAGWVRSLGRALQVALPYFAVPVRKTSFNARLSGNRALAATSFSLDEFRAIKAATGASVNDLALAITGTAVGRYLASRGEPTDRNLRVLVPVNVRAEDERGRLGNRISMVLVEVPLDPSMSPGERLEAISRRTSWLKSERAADGIELVGDELLSLPTPLLRVFSAFGPLPNTVANMVITNVPGPTIPLYTVGHRLLSHLALAPLSWEMGLGCAVTSYDGEICFTLQADPNLVPDLPVITGLIVEANEELQEAAGLTNLSLIEEDVTVLIVA